MARMPKARKAQAAQSARDTGAEKRAAILAALLELVSRHGFHGAPMSQVAKRARVSAGIIYHYYAGKDALIHALYRDLKLKFTQALAEGDLEGLSAGAAFQRVWLNAYRYHATHPRELAFLEQYQTSPYGRPFNKRKAAETDPHLALLLDLFHPRGGPRRVKRLPPAVLDELGLGTAARLAKRTAKEGVVLDEATLQDIAAACWKAIAA